MERISHAAILLPHKIVFGKSHYEASKHILPRVRFENRNCGFLTSKMRFVFREEARKIAFESGQITEENSMKTFISERLWSARDGGVHDYDEVIGYMPKKNKLPGSEQDNEC